MLIMVPIMLVLMKSLINYAQNYASLIHQLLHIRQAPSVHQYSLLIFIVISSQCDYTFVGVLLSTTIMLCRLITQPNINESYLCLLPFSLAVSLAYEVV